METNTIILLESYNPNITELNISGETITPTINGILDLSRFVNLEYLLCKFCKIDSIINITPTLKKIECDHNNIEQLDNLFEGLELLWCNHNKIKSLDNLPSTLESLNCHYNQIKTIDNLPNNFNFFTY